MSKTGHFQLAIDVRAAFQRNAASYVQAKTYESDTAGGSGINGKTSWQRRRPTPAGQILIVYRMTLHKYFENR